jgi:hypothetical protein
VAFGSQKLTETLEATKTSRTTYSVSMPLAIKPTNLKNIILYTEPGAILGDDPMFAISFGIALAKP